MTTIIDPIDSNVALVDGEIAYAFRLVPVIDPSHPTILQLSKGFVIGYGQFEEES